MERHHITRKHLAVGIVLLFLGVTVAQGIVADVTQISRGTPRNALYSPEKSTVICHYFTIWGVEQVEKELSIQDAAYLSQLMNTSDSVTLASELNRYGLVPQTMKVQQITELLSETYLQNEFQKTQRLLHTHQVSDTDWMKNSLCSISGYGPSSYYSTPKSAILRFVLVYGLYLFVTLPGASLALLLSRLLNNDLLPMLLMMFFYVPQMIAEELLSIGQVICPLKLSPAVVVAELFDLYGHTPPHLNTSGTNGNWTIQNYQGIGMHMIGFFGIWLTIRIQSQFPSASVKGHCLNINAKGLDDYYWDGWRDWP